MSQTVVIADGDADSRAVAAETIRRAGLTALEVETGAAALDASSSSEVVLVILEVGLPDMTGYEVCCEIKGRREDLPIFFLSGIRTEPIDRVAGLLLGADDFIVKPFDSGELIARVRRFAGRSKPASVRNGGNGPSRHLTQREQEVLTLLAQGLRQKAIAQELYISSKTVGTHVQNLLSKFGVHSRAELVARAYQERLAGSSAE